ncbi:MAG: site-2 protease family protein [Candidatus Pacebacteria bacterium]|nr:site-2 protease family protein [Candidatus Paceibacterota bacterium]
MDPLTTLFSIIVLIFSVILHEVAHGVVAVRLGDPTPRLQGRITLNPIPHIDLFGSIILPLLLVITGSGIVLGWAKPVQYNERNLTDKKYGALKVAMAGPLTNIVIALLFGLLSYLALVLGLFTSAFMTIASIVILVNLSLACFNLIPIPPLDGHYLLFAFLPASWHRFRETLRRQSFILMILMVFFLWQLFTPLIFFLYRLLMSGI